MLGTARLLGRASGAALVALMLNQFGDNGTRLADGCGYSADCCLCQWFYVSLMPRSGHKSASFGTRFYLYFILLQVFTRTQSFNTFIQRRVSHEQLTERFRLTVNAESHHAGCFLRFIAGFQALQRGNHFLATNQFC